MALSKVGWLKDSTMKSTGVFSEAGECLVAGKFDSSTCDSFNGVEKKVKAKKK